MLFILDQIISNFKSHSKIVWHLLLSKHIKNTNTHTNIHISGITPVSYTHLDVYKRQLLQYI